MGQNKINPGEFITEMQWMEKRVETTPSGAERKTWTPTSVFLSAIEDESREYDVSGSQRREVFGIVFVAWFAPVGIGQKVLYDGKSYAINKIEPLEKRMYGRYSCKTDGYADSES